VPVDGSIAAIVSRADGVALDHRAVTIQAIASASGFERSRRTSWSRTQLQPLTANVAELPDGFSTVAILGCKLLD